MKLIKLFFGVIIFALTAMPVSAVEEMQLLAPLKQYRGIQTIKSDVIKNTDYVIPLDNLKRLGRDWLPTNSKLLQGDLISSLYELGRGEELDHVYSFYRKQLTDEAKVLYECLGRDCGGSNAWANNFFDDYRLYGADENQFLLVTEKNSNLYQVLYINRRGAGDVMVRLDRVVVEDNEPVMQNQRIAFQTEANNFNKIREYIEEHDDGNSYTAIVSSEKQLLPVAAVKDGEQLIKAIKQNLGIRLTSKVIFINVANFGRDEFGERLVTLLKNDD